jgi:aminoglycoside phosphotransferase (APT) family kinase protein
MRERSDFNFGDLDIDLARRIDEVCRRFEADCRAGRQPRVDDYLDDVPEEARPALRAQHQGQHYFSMGFVEGQSLSQRLAEGPLPARGAAELIRRVSEAIEYAHQRGVIHRDLKPANILRPKRQPAGHRLRAGQEGAGR